MLDDPPQARVVLAKPLGRIGDRHRLGQRQHVGLEQQREPGTRPSPRRGDLAHLAVRTAHSRHTSVQQRAMLEEVQMPPRFILRVVNRATLASALGAGEPAPARKVHIQIEPTILDRKLATRHRPRRLQPKGQLEKIGVSHPLTINSIPTDRSPSEPKKRPYPLHSARSPNSARTQARYAWLAPLSSSEMSISATLKSLGIVNLSSDLSTCATT